MLFSQKHYSDLELDDTLQSRTPRSLTTVM